MRAQIESQVIVYILAVVIMAMVLVFGYQAVESMKKQADVAQLLAFRSGLTNDIKAIGGDYGSSKVKSFSVPAIYRQVCFVNLDHQDSEGNRDALMRIEEYEQAENKKVSGVIKDLVFSVTKSGYAYDLKNVFLCPTCVDQLYVGNITILDAEGNDVAFRCFSTIQGSLKLRIAGLGRVAQIS